ncbi:polysaccharide biosynthesis/export family protein [Paenochrobactrum sp. BZR 588]|uniref:polysaccharide biosynthesis/export family protein n=1 Tax=unclassified Paenochrobactrum TaxID=2639760 RepID=UPI003853C9DE
MFGQLKSNNGKTKCAFLAIAAVCLSLSGCSGYRPAPDSFYKVLNQPYILDAGDRIRVTVFEQSDLTNTYNVDPAGFISFPLIGNIPARGKTLKQLEAEISNHLRNGYLRQPNVSVEIDRYRPVFIMGEVGAAGQYSYVPGMTAQKAIAAAGGFSPRANQSDIDITRQIKQEIITGRVMISAPIMPGDTIYVRERLF